MKVVFASKLTEVVSILLIVGILTLMSRINFMLIQVEHEKSFITSVSGPSSLIHNLAYVKCFF